MKSILAKLSCLGLLLGCGGQQQAASTPMKRSGDEMPAPLKSEHVFPTFNYPVTICGTASATSKDAKTAEYTLRNGHLVIDLIAYAESDADVLETFAKLRGISPHGADGCVHGLELPMLREGENLFYVAKATIAVASGGFSVSSLPLEVQTSEGETPEVPTEK